MTSRLLIKFPSRSRVRQFRQVFKTMVDNAEDRDNIHFLFTLDTDDPKYREYIKSVRGIAASFSFDAGTSTSKVHAINRGMEKAPQWDIVLLASDDMHCQQKGWDNRIRRDMQENFPELDGVLWYPDGHQKDICTLVIMGRKAYERDGYLYHPSYKSVYCDNEWTDVWREREKLAFIDLILYEHRHPAWGNGRRDKLYDRNEEPKMYAADGDNYRHRKSQKFAA